MSVPNALLPLLQQCPVLLDLLLQASLDAQEHLVLLVLALQLTADAGQLLLQGPDHALDLLQLHVIATFRVFQVGLQGVYLQRENKMQRLWECGDFNLFLWEKRRSSKILRKKCIFEEK